MKPANVSIAHSDAQIEEAKSNLEACLNGLDQGGEDGLQLALDKIYGPREPDAPKFERVLQGPGLPGSTGSPLTPEFRDGSPSHSPGRSSNNRENPPAALKRIPLTNFPGSSAHLSPTPIVLSEPKKPQRSRKPAR